MSLKVNEIFYSIQGEGSRSGRPCVFIRLTGCPVRCLYCDTPYAFHEGCTMEIVEVVAKVVTMLGPYKSCSSAPFVELTGGEPLAQRDAIPLLAALVDLGCEVALETAGSHDVRLVPRDVIKIVDRKTPDSGASQHWLESNLDCLTDRQDELKFVLCSCNDYYWAKSWCEARGIFGRLNVIFSPVWGSMNATWLAEEIIRDRIPVRFQLQIQKLIWSPDRCGV